MQGKLQYSIVQPCNTATPKNTVHDSTLKPYLSMKVSPPDDQRVHPPNNIIKAKACYTH